MINEIITHKGFKIVFLPPHTLAAYRNDEYMRQDIASYSVTVEAEDYSEPLRQLTETIDSMSDEGEFGPTGEMPVLPKGVTKEPSFYLSSKGFNAGIAMEASYETQIAATLYEPRKVLEPRLPVLVLTSDMGKQLVSDGLATQLDVSSFEITDDGGWFYNFYFYLKEMYEGEMPTSPNTAVPYGKIVELFKGVLGVTVGVYLISDLKRLAELGYLAEV